MPWILSLAELKIDLPIPIPPLTNPLPIPLMLLRMFLPVLKPFTPLFQRKRPKRSRRSPLRWPSPWPPPSPDSLMPFSIRRRVSLIVSNMDFWLLSLIASIISRYFSPGACCTNGGGWTNRGVWIGGGGGSVLGGAGFTGPISFRPLSGRGVTGPRRRCAQGNGRGPGESSSALDSFLRRISSRSNTVWLTDGSLGCASEVCVTRTTGCSITGGVSLPMRCWRARRIRVTGLIGVEGPASGMILGAGGGVGPRVGGIGRWLLA